MTAVLAPAGTALVPPSAPGKSTAGQPSLAPQSAARSRPAAPAPAAARQAGGGSPGDGRALAVTGRGGRPGVCRPR